MLIPIAQITKQVVLMDVRVPKKVLQRIQPDIDAGICITPECDKPKHARGLCSSCLKTANAMVENGQTTFDELIRGGLILPPAKPGRKPGNAMAKAIKSLSS